MYYLTHPDQDSFSLRETFSFDKKIYRDSSVEVTPCVLVLHRRRLPSLFRTIIPVQDIDFVQLEMINQLPHDPKKQRPRSSGRFFIKALKSRALKIREPCHPSKQLVIHIEGEKLPRVINNCEDPDNAFVAICNAMNTFY